MGTREVTIKANVVDVLEILKENRTNHREIVEEARAGYVEKAEAALRRKLDRLLSGAKEGKMVSLNFSLYPPQDHTEVYDSMISMLELHTEDTIELTGEQHHNFIEDKWGWSSNFYYQNSAYSETAAELAEEEDD